MTQRRSGLSLLIVTFGWSLLAQQAAKRSGLGYNDSTTFRCVYKDLQLQIALPTWTEVTDGKVGTKAWLKAKVVSAAGRRIQGVLMHPDSNSPLASRTLILTAYCRIVEESGVKAEDSPEECADKSRYTPIAGTRLTTETGQKGEFLFKDVAPGSYMLFVQRPRFNMPIIPGRETDCRGLPGGVPVTEGPGMHSFLVFASKDVGESTVYRVRPNDSFDLMP